MEIGLATDAVVVGKGEGWCRIDGKRVPLDRLRVRNAEDGTDLQWELRQVISMEKECRSRKFDRSPRLPDARFPIQHAQTERY